MVTLVNCAILSDLLVLSRRSSLGPSRDRPRVDLIFLDIGTPGHLVCWAAY